MRAQSVIFDVISTSFGSRRPNYEMTVGEIHQDLLKVMGTGSTPSIPALIKALALLVETGELVARGPLHDAYSTLYHRPE